MLVSFHVSGTEMTAYFVRVQCCYCHVWGGDAAILWGQFEGRRGTDLVEYLYCTSWPLLPLELRVPVPWELSVVRHTTYPKLVFHLP